MRYVPKLCDILAPSLLPSRQCCSDPGSNLVHMRVQGAVAAAQAPEPAALALQRPAPRLAAAPPPLAVAAAQAPLAVAAAPPGRIARAAPHALAPAAGAWPACLASWCFIRPLDSCACFRPQTHV